MIIKSIVLNNFRQFKGKQKLTFSEDPDKNVTVLLGDNTFGKTTILQAFNWCFYNSADFPKDSNPDFLLNLEVADSESGKQQKCEVFVEVTLEHEKKEYVIHRKQPYIDRSYNDWSPLSSQLSVTYKENGITKSVRETEEQNVINSILPQSLSKYFFFDTERVSDIGSKNLADEVRGLLGLTAVKNSRDHLGSKTAKTTVIGGWYNDLDTSGDEKAREAADTISKETEEKEKLEAEIKTADEELTRLNIQKEKIDEILRDNQNTAELQKNKQDLEIQLNNEKEELQECNKLFLDFYNNGALSYFMLPLMDKAKRFLADAQVDDRGIQDMTAASIMDIIKRGRCICGAKIEVGPDGKTGNDVYMHILDELRFLPPENIGTAIRNYKQLLDSDKKNTSIFYPTIDQKYKEIQKHRNTILTLEDKISKIEESIFGKENMSDYEADLNRIKADIKRMNEKKERCNRDIGACEKAIREAEKVRDSLVGSSERNKKLIRYIAYAEKICSWIDETFDEKEQELRSKLQEKVNQTFSKMYHGERRVQIDKHYQVTLFSQINGKEVVTGESEGLKRVKNFAFIAGLVDLAKEKATLGKTDKDSISWENEAYPLVMDAPFSNADETHIKNISSVLPEVANQVIMFVMEKDWQYAEGVMAPRIGKYCKLEKVSESYTKIA